MIIEGLSGGFDKIAVTLNMGNTTAHTPLPNNPGNEYVSRAKGRPTPI